MLLLISCEVSFVTESLFSSPTSTGLCLRWVKLCKFTAMHVGGVDMKVMTEKAKIRYLVCQKA